MQKLLTFLSKSINIFAILQDRNFNFTIAKNLSFEQLGPECVSLKCVFLFLLVGTCWNRLAEAVLMTTTI